jgi:GTPase
VVDDNLQSHCGFIAIIGRPNVGKSTLMNHLVGQKLSITSRKPQTTRHKISGILTENHYQYIFVDTPGFQKQYVNKMNTLLNQSVITSLKDVDVIVLVVEAGIFNEGDELVLSLLPKSANVILAINKQDQIKDKMELNRFVKEISKKYKFNAVVPVSAKHHLGIDNLLAAAKQYLPQGPFLYDEDQLTNRSNKFLASEIIREKLFRYLGEELPYSLTVEIDEFKEEDKLYRIAATVIVDKDNQKGIVIGKDGEKLKKVSTEARLDMEKLFEHKVFLQVWVKVRSGFADTVKFLKQFEDQ